MQIKTAKVEMGDLLKTASAENQENLGIAKHNARCDPDKMKAYKSAAQRALVRGVKDLIDIAESGTSS